ncbi:MAG: ERF family protein, partial [Aeriscardovia sp.]|nr:ERF family protein [Aeriscardovia sp.]
MNVFEKLNEARVRFQSANVKKSGTNKFAGYTYYELSDILPAINMLARELKFT